MGVGGRNNAGSVGQHALGGLVLLALSALLGLLGPLPRLRAGLPIREGDPRVRGFESLRHLGLLPAIRANTEAGHGRNRKHFSGGVRPGGHEPPVVPASTALERTEGLRSRSFLSGPCRPESQSTPGPPKLLMIVCSASWAAVKGNGACAEVSTF